MRVICHHPSFATSPPASKSALLHSGIPQRVRAVAQHVRSLVRSSALGTFFPADKLPARAKERAWKRVSEEAGPPTHPFSLPSFLPPFLASAPVRLFPSFPLPQPKRSPYESKIFSHPIPLPSSRDPRFLLTGEEGESGAHSAVQTSAWGAASLKRGREVAFPPHF